MSNSILFMFASDLKHKTERSINRTQIIYILGEKFSIYGHILIIRIVILNSETVHTL